MAFELLMGVVVAASDGGFLDGAVHSFNLTIGPEMVDLDEAVLEVVSRQRMANMCVMNRAVGPSA